MIARAEAARAVEAVRDKLGHERVTSLEFFGLLRWIDGTPLPTEPYRRAIFSGFLDTVEPDGRVRYNLGLYGRAKKTRANPPTISTNSGAACPRTNLGGCI